MCTFVPSERRDLAELGEGISAERPTVARELASPSRGVFEARLCAVCELVWLALSSILCFPVAVLKTARFTSSLPFAASLISSESVALKKSSSQD